MADLTAIILTKNEEKNIQKCIASIRGITKRIVVVDSGSTDQTVEIAKSLGAEVVIHPLSPFLYAKQFIYGMEYAQINTKWVLRIDADEELTEESASEIDRLCEENSDTDVNGLILRFKVNFMGRDLMHGGTYPVRKLLVFKYGKGYIEDRKMDEHILLSEGKAIEVKADSLHHDFKDLTIWTDKHNQYATREMQDYYDVRYGADDNAESLDRKARIKRYIKYHIYYKLPAGFRTWSYYMYRYVLRGGFLDGREGKIYAFLQAYWYRFLVDAKIYEKNKKGRQEK